MEKLPVSEAGFGFRNSFSSESEFTPKSIPTKDDRANLVYAVKVAVENDGYIKLL